MSSNGHVPTFGDLGELARDLLRSGYTFDQVKIKLIKPLNDFCLEAHSFVNLKNFEPGISGLLRYKTESYGKFSGKVSNDGPVVLEYNCDGVCSENVNIVAGYSINIADSFQSCKLATQYFNSVINATCSLTKDFDRNVDLLGSVVLRSNNFLAGYQCGFDTNSSQITKSNVALALDHSSMILHLRCVQIPREFGLSTFYAVNEKLDVAVDSKMAYNQEMSLWYMAAGFAYKLNDDCKMRMKFDKNMQLGTNMQLKFKEGLLLTLAFSLDLLNLKAGQHKIGFGLDISA